MDKETKEKILADFQKGLVGEDFRQHSIGIAIRLLENILNAPPENEIAGQIKKLKELLSPEGNYSICRSDGEKMGLGDTMIVGEILEQIDNWLVGRE